MEAVPPAWYERWWVWTIVGAATATGVAIGVGLYVDGAASLPAGDFGPFYR